MKKTMTKTKLYGLMTVLFCCSLLVSNVLAAKTFSLGNIILPCAVIVFPLVYIINDVMAEIYGFEKARTAILTGFVMNVIATIFYMVALALPAVDAATDNAFATVLGSTPRMLLASFAAYLCGSLLNTHVMARMKATGSNKLMLRCVVSTLVGEGVDALIFISIAFVGTMPLSVLATMIISQAAFKTIYEIVVYPITRTVIRKVDALND